MGSMLEKMWGMWNFVFHIMEEEMCHQLLMLLLVNATMVSI